MRIPFSKFECSLVWFFCTDVKITWFVTFTGDVLHTKPLDSGHNKTTCTCLNFKLWRLHVSPSTISIHTILCSWFYFLHGCCFDVLDFWRGGFCLCWFFLPHLLRSHCMIPTAVKFTPLKTAPPSPSPPLYGAPTPHTRRPAVKVEWNTYVLHSIVDTALKILLSISL